MKTTLSFALLSVLVTSSVARADRDGLVLGASIDGGHIGCETASGADCGDGAHPAGGLSVHVGGMISPRLGTIGEVWGMAHSADNVTASQVLLTGNIRLWLVPRLWVQGGIGVARSKLSFEASGLATSTESDTVPAGVLAVGVELLHSPNFGLDLQLRAGSGFYRGDARVWNTALGFGVTWF